MMTKLKVLVLCFPYFTHHSNVLLLCKMITVLEMLVYISLSVVYLYAYAFVQVFIVMCGEPTLTLRSS
jgi:hypothetical protein